MRCRAPSPQPLTSPKGKFSLAVPPHLQHRWDMYYLCSIGPVAEQRHNTGKNVILVQAQATYDGACMVYGRNKAHSFIGSPDPNGHAYVHTFTTDGTALNTFAHYSSESQGQVKYHQFPTSSSLLISSYEDFKESRQRLRNQQDDGEENLGKVEG